MKEHDLTKFTVSLTWRNMTWLNSYSIMLGNFLAFFCLPNRKQSVWKEELAISDLSFGAEADSAPCVYLPTVKVEALRDCDQQIWCLMHLVILCSTFGIIDFALYMIANNFDHFIDGIIVIVCLLNQLLYRWGSIVDEDILPSCRSIEPPLLFLITSMFHLVYRGVYPRGVLS